MAVGADGPDAGRRNARPPGWTGSISCSAYDGAGHLIRLGLLPTDAPWTNGIAFGGSREGLAAAQADATTRVVDFLEILRVGSAAVSVDGQLISRT